MTTAKLRLKLVIFCAFTSVFVWLIVAYLVCRNTFVWLLPAKKKQVLQNASFPASGWECLLRISYQLPVISYQLSRCYCQSSHWSLRLVLFTVLSRYHFYGDLFCRPSTTWIGNNLYVSTCGRFVISSYSC